MNYKSRPAISEKVKREIRQKCGFGCIFCGDLIVQYDHYDPPYEDAIKLYPDNPHRPEGMTLLCPGCHAKKNTKSSESFNNAVLNPFNIKRGVSIGKDLIDLKDPVKVQIGRIFFTASIGKLFEIDGVDILRITPATNDDPVFININFQDESGSNLIIENNEIIAGIDNWDIVSTIHDDGGCSIIIRRKLRDIFLGIKIKPDHDVIVENLNLITHNWHIKTKSDGGLYINSLTHVNKTDLPEGELKTDYIKMNDNTVTMTNAVLSSFSYDSLLPEDQVSMQQIEKMAEDFFKTLPPAL